MRRPARHLQTLGDEHMDTSVSMGNLASLLFQQGDLEEALPLYQRCAQQLGLARLPEARIVGCQLQPLPGRHGRS
jgi:hypothetical protein